MKRQIGWGRTDDFFASPFCSMESMPSRGETAYASDARRHRAITLSDPRTMHGQTARDRDGNQARCGSEPRDCPRATARVAGPNHGRRPEASSDHAGGIARIACPNHRSFVQVPRDGASATRQVVSPNLGRCEAPSLTYLPRATRSIRPDHGGCKAGPTVDPVGFTYEAVPNRRRTLPPPGNEPAWTAADAVLDGRRFLSNHLGGLPAFALRRARAQSPQVRARRGAAVGRSTP